MQTQEKTNSCTMKQIALSLLMLLAVALVPGRVLAAEESAAAVSDSASVEEGFDMMEVIGHHISNSHTWNVFGYKNAEGEEVEVKIPLPVLAYYKGTFLCALSSSFDEGGVVEKNGYSFYLEHEQLLVKGEEDKPFDFSITRNVASMFLSCLILVLVFVGAARSYRKSAVPHGGNSLVEMAVLFVKDIADDQIGKEKSGKYTVYLLTLFFFIWFNNVIGLIPFFPGSSNLSGNISFTAVLAIFTFIITNWNGTKAYWKHNLTVPVFRF